MNKKLWMIISVFMSVAWAHAQTANDSIIRLSDLQYHSDFEKTAIINYSSYHKDTFNVFMAIDEKMTAAKAAEAYKTYQSVFAALQEKKINEKKLNSKVKVGYTVVHDRFLKKYNNNIYFPEIFNTGVYNCATASMLYSMVFDRLQIPYKIMATSGHVYLIAIPGTHSIVIETTNPGFEKAVFNGEFKRQYVNYLSTSKLISDSELKSKSVEEIFEEHYNEVKEAQFNNLPGFQYYNEAIKRFEANDIDNALKFSQKAYFFYPDPQVKSLLYATLLMMIEKSEFSKVTDIDYLVQLSRFENSRMDLIVGVFGNIINHYLQYTDKENYCESLYQRLIDQITDAKLKEEISFNFNLQMGMRYANTDKVEKYMANALKIKGNHNNANFIFENHIRSKLNSIDDPGALLDTIKSLDSRYGSLEVVKKATASFKLVSLLKKAEKLFEDRKPADGIGYLKEFENLCLKPVTDNSILEFAIANAYLAAHNFYIRTGNKTKAKSFQELSNRYAPNCTRLYFGQ